MTATQINFSTGETISLQDNSILVEPRTYFSVDLPENHPLAILGATHLRQTEYHHSPNYKLEILSIHWARIKDKPAQVNALKIEILDNSGDLYKAFHASLRNRLWEKEFIPAYTKFFNDLDKDYVDAQETWAKYLVEKFKEISK